MAHYIFTSSSIFTIYIGSDELKAIKAAANKGISSHHSSLISALYYLLGRCLDIFSCRNLLIALAKTLAQPALVHLNVDFAIVNQLRQGALLEYYFFYNDNIPLYCLFFFNIIAS